MDLDYYRAKISHAEEQERAKFAEEFKDIRLANNLSVGEAAARMGVSTDLIERIEAGCVSPNIGTMSKRMGWLSARKMRIG